jgi:hypothetical protein
LCVSAFCGVPRRHRDNCEDADACRGCLPAQAADGLYLCQWCLRRLSHDAFRAAWLFESLGVVLTGGGRAGDGGVRSGGDPGIDLNPAMLEAREAIGTTLVALVRLVVEERGVATPGASPPAMATFLARHAQWLAAHRAADEHARDLRDIATDARTFRLAFPSGSDRLYIGRCPLRAASGDGVCGARLYQRADEPLLTCPGCEVFAVVQWWQRQLVGQAGDGIADAYIVAAMLSVQWSRPVLPSLLRVWAHRGHVARHGRDDRGRVLYDLGECRAYARRIWGAAAPG